MLARLKPRLEAMMAAVESGLEAERQQLPLWVPVALLAGIAAWFLLPDMPAWIGFITLAFAVAIAAATFGGGRRAAGALAWFSLLAGIGCGLIWTRAEMVRAPRLERPQVVSFLGRVVEVERLVSRDRLRLLLAPRDSPGLPPQVRVTVPIDTPAEELKPGAIIRLRAYLLPPPPMAVPGAYDFARTAWFARIGATGRALGPIVVESPAETTGWREWLSTRRLATSEHILTQLPGGPGAIAVALATGDQGAINAEDAEAMRRSGLAHLLSVSGLHITAVVGAVMLATLALLALSPWLALRVNLVLVAAAAAAIAGIAYTIFTGMQVPTVRSCIAALLVLGGIAMGREAITLRLVATGAVIVLLLWPEAAAQASFQLSFAAVTAIVALHEHPRIRALLARREEGWPRRFGRGLIGLLLTGLAVEAAISPIALFHFHQAGLYGAIANIVAIPLTTFIIMPLEALALLLDLIGLGAPIWWLTGQALNLLLGLAHAVGTAPGAVALVPAIPPLAFGLVVAGLLWAGLWRSRWRWWGGAPFAAGAIWALATPAPDLLVTGDGRHLAARLDDGRLALLRPRAGDYVRDLLAELSGAEAEFVDMDAAPGAACSDALCVHEIRRGGRMWRVLATRGRDFVAWDQMMAACAAADIIVADRRLPDACQPRWLRADRPFLEHHGGLAFSLSDAPGFRTVRQVSGRHPWAK